MDAVAQEAARPALGDRPGAAAGPDHRWPSWQTRRWSSLRPEPLLLLLLSYLLLVGAFIVTNPPGQASDEPANFYKAAALAHGQLVGEPARIVSTAGWSQSQLAWLNKTTREFSLPPRLAGCGPFSLPAPTCPDLGTRTERPLLPGQQLSYVGTYPPASYVPPAIGIRVAEAVGLGPIGTVRAARAAGALVDLVLMAVAALLVLGGRRSPFPVLALVLIATPLVLFTMSQVSSSGLEIAAAICFAAGLLRLSRAAAEPPAAWVWVATAVSGVLFVMCRPTSPPWCLLVLSLVVLLRPRGMWRAVRAARWKAVATGAALAAGSLSTLLWVARVEPKRPPVSLGEVLGNLPLAWERLPGVAEQAVGRLGWINIPLDAQLVYLWWLLIVVFLLAALLVGSWWERLVLLLGGVGVVALTLLVDAGVQLPTTPDFQMQARYVFAAAVVVPLLAAEILQRRRTNHLDLLLCAAAVGVLLQLSAAAVVTNMRPYMAGPVLESPLGWSGWQWVVTVAVPLGLLAVGLSGAARAPVSPARSAADRSAARTG